MIARDPTILLLRSLAIVVALAALLPLIALAIFALASAPSPFWQESRFFLITLYLKQNFLLAAGASLTALILGTTTGWIVAACRFPARTLLAWMLVLPLALPPYVLAYVYGELFDQFPFLPPIRSLTGGIILLGLALYPYVYLAARLAFTRDALSAFQAARALGQPVLHCFWRTALPAARPALAAGVALVAMEALNDIGLSEYFGIRTLSAGIYDLWLNRGDLVAALRVALLLLLSVFALLALERALRGNKRYHPALSRPARRFPLPPLWQAGALFICLLPPLLGFFLPAFLLGLWVFYLPEPASALMPLAARSLTLAVPAALLVVMAAFLLAYFVRLHAKNRFAQGTARLAVMGYAIPGAVLALGILAPLALWNRNAPAALAITGLAPLLFAYFVRFLILPYGLAEAALARIRPSLDHAAQLLGARADQRFIKVHFPLLRPALMAGLLLVFIEVMRELPATLILRPFNFETLATRLYDYASLGLFEQAAAPALLLLFLGLAPALVWHQSRQRLYR